MLNIPTSYKVIHHTLTYRKIILSMIILIHITYSPSYLSAETDDMHDCFFNSNNTFGGSCTSSHQAVSKFTEHHIDMVSCIHCKCQTRAGVPGNINKTIDCVTKTDGKFFNRVLYE